MNELMDIIKGRRSIRKYQDKEVPEELLRQVLESVRWSPSWVNTQCWEVIVVKDPATRIELQETLVKTNPARNAMVEAPMVLVLCGKLKISGYYKQQESTRLGDWFMFDLGLATQNLCLTAYNAGLGTVIVGLFDHKKATEILGVPEEGYELVAMIPLGFPAKDSPVTRRREITEFTHYEKF
ncbi:MAG: nitroreductase family protein [Thermodesulfobacteriota bacterium]|nr:nitroreductase family protein [Thermodesulfobacteriota bacterium]